MVVYHYVPKQIHSQKVHIPAETVHVNVEGTEQVLQACRVGTVESLVFASTAAVYGVNGVPHTEEDSPDPLDIYGMSKFFGEELVRLYHRETQVRCGIARLFNGYGPRETNPHVIPAIAEQLRHGRRLALGNTKPRRDFVHTRDIARAVWAMAVEGEGGCEVFNVGTGRSVSVDDLIQVFSDLLGQPIDLMTDPDRVRTVERMDLVGDVQKLDRHYGWKAQVDLREGLAELLEEYGVRS